MIFDQIENAKKYLGLHPNLDVALQNIESPEALRGEAVKCNPAAYETVADAESDFEAHRLYADIHIAVGGAERIGIADVQKLNFSRQVAEDAFFYTGEEEASVILKPGTFLVVFPGEGHRLKLHPGKPSSVEKRVFKILMD